MVSQLQPPKAHTKEKIDKLDIIKNHKLWTANTTKKMKRQLTKWNKIFANQSDAFHWRVWGSRVDLMGIHGRRKQKTKSKSDTNSVTLSINLTDIGPQQHTRKIMSTTKQ